MFDFCRLFSILKTITTNLILKTSILYCEIDKHHFRVQPVITSAGKSLFNESVYRLSILKAIFLPCFCIIARFIQHNANCSSNSALSSPPKS